MIFWAASWLIAIVALGQTPTNQTSGNPDSLQNLLTEVHQLRLAIEGLTVASQRVQIALYALQMQDAAVSRARQRLDAQKTKCDASRKTFRERETRVRGIEASLAANTMPEGEAKITRTQLPALRAGLDSQLSEVHSCEAAEAEASSQLRNDESKLSELQDRITRLDKALEQFGTVGR